MFASLTSEGLSLSRKDPLGAGALSGAAIMSAMEIELRRHMSAGDTGMKYSVNPSAALVVC